MLEQKDLKGNDLFVDSLYQVIAWGLLWFVICTDNAMSCGWDRWRQSRLWHRHHQVRVGKRKTKCHFHLLLFLTRPHKWIVFILHPWVHVFQYSAVWKPAICMMTLKRSLGGSLSSMKLPTFHETLFLLERMTDKLWLFRLGVLAGVFWKMNGVSLMSPGWQLADFVPTHFQPTQRSNFNNWSFFNEVASDIYKCDFHCCIMTCTNIWKIWKLLEQYFGSARYIMLQNCSQRWKIRLNGNKN